MIYDFIFSGGFIRCGNRPPCHWSRSIENRPIHNVLSDVAAHDRQRHGDEWPGIDTHELSNQARREVRLVRELRSPGNHPDARPALRVHGVRPKARARGIHSWPDSADLRSLHRLWHRQLRQGGRSLRLSPWTRFRSWRSWSAFSTDTPGRGRLLAVGSLRSALITKRGQPTLRSLHGTWKRRGPSGRGSGLVILIPPSKRTVRISRSKVRRGLSSSRSFSISFNLSNDELKRWSTIFDEGEWQ